MTQANTLPFSIRHTALAALAALALLAGCDRQSAQAPAASSAAAAAASDAASAAQAPAAVVETKLSEYAGPFQLTGMVKGVKDGTPVRIEPKYGDRGDRAERVLAKGVVKGGQFELKGEVKDAPVHALLLIGEGIYDEFILEKGELRAERGDDNILSITGGPLNDVAYGYRKSADYQRAAAALEVHSSTGYEGIAENDEARMTAARKKSDELGEPVLKAQVEHLRQQLEKAPSAVNQLMVFGAHANILQWSAAQYESALSHIERQLGPLPVVASLRADAKGLAEAEAKQSELAVGTKFRDIEVVDEKGKRIKLADVVAANKLVLLDFWASWCGPCRAEFPHLRKVYAEHKAAGFEIIGVSIDSEDAAWRKALQEENTPWINTLDLDGKKASEIYGVTGVPQSYLIAKDGTIVSSNDREWAIGRAVAKHMSAK